MKQLSKIIFVNWYLFEAQEWDIRGNTALLGANGAGKSSFLDGIQLALFGGDKRYWKPNAKAPGGHHTVRNVRSYMLGITKTEEAIANHDVYKPRESALTRIALVFEDTDTGEHTSIGVAAHVRMEDDREEYESFFVAEGLELSLDHFLTVTEDGRFPKDIREFEKRLRKDVPQERCHIFKTGTEYLEQMLISLGPTGMPPAVDKFRRSFKQSITLANLDGSVSDFVKSNILEASPVDAQRMREARNSYLFKLEAVTRIREQIERLLFIEKELKSADRDVASALSYEWCAAEAEVQRLDNRIADDEENMAENLQRFRRAKKSLRSLVQQAESQREEMTQLQVLLAKDDNQAKVAQVRKDIDAHSQAAHTDQSELKRCRDIIKQVINVEGKGFLGEDYLQALDALARESVDSELLWPVNPQETDQKITDLVRLSAGQIQSLRDAGRNLYSDSKQLEKELAELLATSDQLKQGRRPLKRNTETLQRLLEKHGIHAMPVCDVIEVSDPQWQKAIEAYLKNHVEALVVDPADALRAISVYRSNRDDLFGAIVVNTHKVQHWNDAVRSGTAAELIEGSDPNAVKYVQRILGNLQLVDSDEELSKADRAITKDGMSAGNGSIQKMKLPASVMIGSGAIAEQTELAATRFQQLTQQQGFLNDELKARDTLLDGLQKATDRLELLPSLERLTGSVAEHKAEIDKLERLIESVDLSKTQMLSAQYEEMRHKVKQLELQKEAAREEAVSAKNVFKRCKASIAEKEEELPALDEDRRRIEEAGQFNAQQAAEVWASLEETHSVETPQEHRAFVSHCEEKARDVQKRGARHKEASVRRLGEYNAEYGRDGIALDGLENDNYLALVAPEIEQLQSTGLADREAEMEQALKDAEFYIRQDLAVKLKAQIADMKAALRGLNRELVERPFSSGLVYQFHYERKAEYSDFIDFVEGTSVEEAANMGGLFDESSQLGEVFDHLLTSDADEGHVDYRDYFVYDIEVRDTITGIREMMSRKKATGSGGEQRSPFYVAMGSSLASAYRINANPGGVSKNDGFGLYLADEAFQSMDAENTEQAANYLKSIGLQLFLAAPDESEVKITPCVETILFFIREGNRAVVDVQYPNQSARDLVGGALRAG